jgi:hypothetical protein
VVLRHSNSRALSIFVSFNESSNQESNILGERRDFPRPSQPDG